MREQVTSVRFAVMALVAEAVTVCELGSSECNRARLVILQSGLRGVHAHATCHVHAILPSSHPHVHAL